MSRPTLERVLLIGDQQRQVEAALVSALPGAQITSVGTYFDAIAELAGSRYTAVLASAEPIERRPEAAVKTLRELGPESRLVLFGHPTLEPLSRKMMDFGCDDYVVTPTSPAELQQVFGVPLLRIAPMAAEPGPADTGEPTDGGAVAAELSGGLVLSDLFLDALVDHPADAAAALIAQLNQRLGPTMQVLYQAGQSDAPAIPQGLVCLSQPVRDQSEEVGQLHLVLPQDEDPTGARHLLSRLAGQLSKIQLLQERHNKLQKLAITDELTGAYNGRYFRHFLSSILERAKVMRFAVTLFLFDIDNFKRYNDQYGHGVGDEILKQTTTLMKRCVREHDRVVRIGGDEFAVVFWEKEGPRQPRDPAAVQTPPGRPPSDVSLILERFRKLISTEQFPGLGPHGRGVLSISGGIAVFPWNGTTSEELIEAADRTLMFGAKRRDGKNSILLVGSGDSG